MTVNINPGKLLGALLFIAGLSAIAYELDGAIGMGGVLVVFGVFYIVVGERYE